MIDILKEIINDNINNNMNDNINQICTLNGIGLVGSFARGDYTKYSDIDLVFDSSNIDLTEDILGFGLTIRDILTNQFNRNVDIINYRTLLSRKDIESDNYFRLGYQQMYNELVWIWRRCW